MSGAPESLLDEIKALLENEQRDEIIRAMKANGTDIADLMARAGMKASDIDQ